MISKERQEQLDRLREIAKKTLSKPDYYDLLGYIQER